MKNTSLFGNILLLAAAIIWGCAFVAQSVGMEYVEPFTFTATRSLIGSACLLPVIFLFRHRKNTDPVNIPSRKDLLISGITSGILLTFAVNLQQIALIYTSVGKAGFITALYIILVPIFGIFLKQKISLSVWFSVIIAAGGLYLLCITDQFSLEFADILLILCAIFFSVQILVVDHYSKKVDNIQLSCLQFFVCGILSMIVMFFTETPQLSALFSAWAPILYTGVLSTGVAYTFQVIGQKYTAPTIASLLMSLESVFSTIAGFIILHQALTHRELWGCALMFFAIILAQFPQKKDTM